jgi:hypothetical protein
MSPAVVESNIFADPPQQLPLKFVQKSAIAGPIIMLMILLPLAGALLAPFLLMAKGLVLDPGMRANLAAHPGTSAQLGLAFFFWCALFAWPIKRIVGQFGRSRSVEIEGGTVHVSDRSPLSTINWQLPISDYEGVAHRIRSSLSGVRHELVLEHSDERRSIVLAMQPRFAESEIAAVRKHFSASLSPARDLYRRLEDAYTVAGTEQFPPTQRQAA